MLEKALKGVNNIEAQLKSEMIENIEVLQQEFSKEASANVLKGNKAAGTRARKYSLALQKYYKVFRRVSVN